MYTASISHLSPESQVHSGHRQSRSAPLQCPCDIVINNKKYIFEFCPVSGTELLKPLESPNR